jgi:polysaccharide pyruvyl transferase WcaK-like protein
MLVEGEMGMRSRPAKIAIFGNFGIGNFGNEATLVAMLESLRRSRSEIELTCICTGPERVQREHQLATLPITRAAPSLIRKLDNILYAIQTVRKFDALLIPGTGILNDFTASPFGMPYTVFRWCLAAKLCGVKTAFVSTGAGPSHHPVTRWLIKRSAAMAQYRSYRNKFSKKFLADLGLDTSHDQIYPDLAFSLPMPSPSGGRSTGSAPLTVCVGAMLYHGWQGHLRTDDQVYRAYLGKLRDFALWLIDQNYRVRLMMGDQNDEKAVNDLQQAIIAERPSFPEDRLIAEPARSHHDVIRQLSEADVVVSSRFHHLVFAVMLGKLTASLGYSPYHAELMDEMGLGAFCQHSDDIQLSKLIAQFNELTTNRGHYDPLIRQAVSAAREKLADQERILDARFLHPPVASEN